MLNTDLKQLDFEKAWNMFKTEVSMQDTDYTRVRFGIRVKFDINEYLQGFINMKPKKV